MQRMTTIRTSVIATVALAVILVTGSAAGSAVSTKYRLIDLGTLGGESSYATAINDRGDVIGSSETADGSYHGFLWRNGRMTDLGAVRPTDINNRGQIVGTLDTALGLEAVLWFRGKVTDLGTLGGASDWPRAINDRGQVVGMATMTSGRSTPFLWSKDRMRKLNLDEVSGINNRGQVTGGQLVDPNGFHASLWSRGTVTDLGAGPFNRSNTYGINDQGWVIGWKFSEQQYERGVLWRNGTATDVGTLGGNRTHLISINGRGQIIGISTLPNGYERPVLWQRGILTDLSGHGIDPYADLADINNQGVIAATVRPAWGISRAVIYR